MKSKTITLTLTTWEYHSLMRALELMLGAFSRKQKASRSGMANIITKLGEAWTGNNKKAGGTFTG